jgi:RHS repeat-associated protein
MGKAPRINRWQFNGQERITDFDLFWNDHGPRQFDLQLGRWWQVDALADDPFQVGLSGYHFSYNSPASFADPSGYCPTCDTKNAHEGDLSMWGGAQFRFDGETWTYSPFGNEGAIITGSQSASISTGSGGWEASVVSHWQGDAFSHNPYVSPGAYLWTQEEIQQGSNIGLSVASLAMGGPGVVMGIRAGLTAGLRAFTFGALADVSVQFGAGMISNQGDMGKAARGINVIESGLAGFGVGPVSAAIYSASFQVSGKNIGFTGASGRDFTYQAIAGGVFGKAGDVLEKRAVPFVLASSLRVSNGLGGRVGTAAGMGLWHGGTFGYNVGAEYLENIENHPLKR